MTLILLLLRALVMVRIVIMVLGNQVMLRALWMHLLLR